MDYDKLLANRTVSGKKKYVQDMLNKIPFNYKKNSFDGAVLMKNLDIALKNEAYFSETLDEFKTKLGSNIGLLMKELQGNIV